MKASIGAGYSPIPAGPPPGRIQNACMYVRVHMRGINFVIKIFLNFLGENLLSRYSVLKFSKIF